MSRSRDGTWLTTRSPILSTPSEMSSSPATMRNAVVFPHPDGPTSTMNSPSSISSWSSSTALVPSAYTLLTRSKATAAISPSLLFGVRILSEVRVHGAVVRRRRQLAAGRALAGARSGGGAAPALKRLAGGTEAAQQPEAAHSQ